MTAASSDDGFALACTHCRYRAPMDAEVSFLAAHFDVEHNTTDVKVELVVVCPRCNGEMAYEHTIGNRNHFTCHPCHRTRVITRTEPAA